MSLAEIETLLSSLWADALSRDSVPPEANLFDLGAGSLSLMSVIARAQEVLEADVPPEVVLKPIFEEPNVRALAAAIHTWLSAPLGERQ
jgi:acyl carrier protein